MIISRCAERSLRRHGPVLPACLRKQFLYTWGTARPTIRVAPVARGRRTTSTESGDNESGHIQTQKNEGILFFDSEPSFDVLPQHVVLIHCRCVPAAATVADPYPLPQPRQVPSRLLQQD